MFIYIYLLKVHSIAICISDERMQFASVIQGDVVSAPKFYESGH